MLPSPEGRRVQTGSLRVTGEDEIWLHGQGIRSRDIVRLRDHETDELHCATGSPADRLLLDGID